MANFFNEERFYCECGSLLFTEEELYILTKETDKEYIKNPYTKVIKCIQCGKIQDNIKIKGE